MGGCMSNNSRGVICQARQRRGLGTNSPSTLRPKPPLVQEDANGQTALATESLFRREHCLRQPAVDAARSETVRRRTQASKEERYRYRADSGETNAGDCEKYIVPHEGIKYHVPKLTLTSDSTIMRRRSSAANRRSLSFSTSH